MPARKTCKRPCPDHGDPCSVVGSTKGEAEMALKLFGASSDFETHLHLCLGGEKPHGWRAQ